MMEYWKSGIMGFGLMQCWINGPARNGIEDKNKMAVYILLKTNIPTFHHSIIGVNSKSQKIYMLSVGYGNSETFY
jgi:hypothetical protein